VEGLQASLEPAFSQAGLFRMQQILPWDAALLEDQFGNSDGLKSHRWQDAVNAKARRPTLDDKRAETELTLV
jgi:hypothetical protein